MADILIRGMEMPTEQRVEVLIFKNGFVAYYDVYGRYIGQAKATPLPEGHGRLIDADAAAKEAYRSLLECEKYGNEFQKPYEIIRAIETAKTIVPAEGGEADG